MKRAKAKTPSFITPGEKLKKKMYVDEVPVYRPSINCHRKTQNPVSTPKTQTRKTVVKAKRNANLFKPSQVVNRDKYLLEQRDVPAAPMTKELICVMKVELNGGEITEELEIYEG